MHYKLHCNALWNTFTAEQQEKLREWLIEENLGIREVHERAGKELGIKCGQTTIHRIHQYLAKFHVANEVAEAQAAAEELKSTGASTEEVRNSTMNLIGTRLLQKTMTQEISVKELAVLGRIVLQGQERQIQQQRVNLARERFQFNASQAALEALPMAEQIKKEDLERERARMEAMRQQIFRKELPYIIE